MHTKKRVVIVGVVALIIGFGAGYVLHTPVKSTGTRGNFTGAFGNGMLRGGGAGGLLSGTVATKDANSITLNTRDGSSHVVLLTPATTVSKSVSGAVIDLSVGSTIIVSGATNSDGSLSASNIQLRPTPPAAQ